MPDKGEKRNKAQIKTPNRRTRMNTEKYQTKKREAKTMLETERGGEGEREREDHDLKVLEGTEEATERNEARKFYATGCRMNTGFQPRMSVKRGIIT